MPTRKTAADWLAENLNLQTVLILVTLLVGWVSNYSTQRAELESHDKRIAVLEAEIVPRSEHESKDRELQQRLVSIEKSLGRIEDKLLGVK